MKSYISPRGVDKDAVIARSVVVIEELFEGEYADDGRAMELAVIQAVYAIGQLLLAALMGRACFCRAQRELRGRNLKVGENGVRFRLERAYWKTAMSTLGAVVFPCFAFRYPRGGAEVTRTPTCELLPSKHCRSTMLLLKMEAAVGSRVPFRQAEGFLSLVTHGHVKLHDSTIAAHNKILAQAVDRKWLYKTSSTIEKLLRTRATLDTETGKPIVCFSSDAHAERLYTGDTFERAWKMLNGIRIWIIDNRTGRLIHLGGEFVVGDCHALASTFDELNALGILPFNGCWGEAQAQLVFVADGMPWFEDHIRAKFSDLAVVLDAYHVLQRVGEFLVKVIRTGSKKAKEVYSRLCRIITGKSHNTAKTSSKLRSASRKNTQKRNKRMRRYPKLTDKHVRQAEERGLFADSASMLFVAIEMLPLSAVPKKYKEQFKHQASLLKYLSERMPQIRYAEAAQRGWPLGSAPMESFNRIAQSRLKIPGATWTPEMAQAMLNLRLLHAVGRVDEFWADPTTPNRISQAFLEAA